MLYKHYLYPRLALGAGGGVGGGRTIGLFVGARRESTWKDSDIHLSVLEEERREERR